MNNYDYVVREGEKSSNYKPFMQSVKASFAILYADVTVSMKDKREAKKVIKFLKDQKFNFDAIRQELLMEKLQVSDELV